MVDIARPSSVITKKKIRRIIYGAPRPRRHHPHHGRRLAAEAGGADVDRATVWIDTVKRGPMLRQVRGSGTLVPEDIRWIPATTQGRVERIVLRARRAGRRPTRVILELSNPELQQAVQRRAARAISRRRPRYANRKAELESALLTRKSDVATIEVATTSRRRSTSRPTRQLYKDEARSPSSAQAEAAARRRELKNRLVDRAEAARDHPRRHQVAARAAGSRRRSAQGARGELRAAQLDDLKVKAGMTRQSLSARCRSKRGAQVGPGTNLARVANPSNLKAELRIAETQTKDIRIGQYAEVDTRNGSRQGQGLAHRPGVDRAARSASTSSLDGALPAGRAARPERRRHDSAREARQRHLCRAPGVRPGEQHGDAVQGDRRTARRIAHQGQARPQLGEHDRDHRGAAARRPGDPLRHVRSSGLRSRSRQCRLRLERWS